MSNGEPKLTSKTLVPAGIVASIVIAVASGAVAFESVRGTAMENRHKIESMEAMLNQLNVTAGRSDERLKNIEGLLRDIRNQEKG